MADDCPGRDVGDWNLHSSDLPFVADASAARSTLGGVRNWLIVALVIALSALVGASVIIGYIGHGQPPVIVTAKGVIPYEYGFDWELAALAFTGFGTFAVAFVTGTLAASTWQDVRASQRIAEASAEASQLARTEQERRPRLTLSWDAEKRDSSPAISEVRVALRVHNAPGLRAAEGTRVLLDRCVKANGQSIAFGSPALRWMGARRHEEDEPVVVFAGAWRVITLGILKPARPWCSRPGWVNWTRSARARRSGSSLVRTKRMPGFMTSWSDGARTR
jgi:hypothetical protein